MLKNEEKKWQEKYVSLNASSKMKINGENNFGADILAAQLYVGKHVKKNTKKFKNFKDRLNFLLDNDYYDAKLIGMYSYKHIEDLTNYAYTFKHSFPSFMGALKFFDSYCLKTFDNKKYLESYEHRVVMNALFLANGDFNDAHSFIKQIITGRFQPATPTFLNAGKKQRGEYSSCYLLRIEDNMESIGKSIISSLQLSKRGGGVALCLTNIREFGSPIKKISGASTGLVPVMKLLEDCFSYANQLGQRQGAGAVYLHAHHPEIIQFLDTKRENADEKIRIKSLSLGIIIPDITFELAKNDEKMALFSPHDVYKVYKKPMSDISITKEYDNMINNDKIKKTYISARKLFQSIAELHFESGYPYLMFDDTVNELNSNSGRIVMSNLCSEILQVSTESQYNADSSYKKTGEDIVCNLASLNIAKVMESGIEFGQVVNDSIKALDRVSRVSNFSFAPSIEKGNTSNHAIGLGAMNLHGFLATNHIYYNSEEAIDFTNIFFYTMAYHAFKASLDLAHKYGSFDNFENSKLADGSYFEKYTTCEDNFWTPKTAIIKEKFEQYNIAIPTKHDWIELTKKIKKDGIANAYLMAIAPTGSISYLSSCSPSLQPVVSSVEIRKEARLGRVYVPAYKINNQNEIYYNDGAYEIKPNQVIDIVAAAQQHIDQGISLTLFVTDSTTTRDLNKAYIRAFKKKCKTIYYVRVRQESLEGSENILESECQACVI
ncbi:class 1b ribonucleoside-diphosphate reductase subunit alpha [Candidatus Mycoplasma mahonii]|uniref:class 1b ribonucleoside-diphosphate reductase subunit alpha n=1 Tax=Candidatus Mycoplasma mahonii TaxID=3004105 RepID=UPI0026F27964|nr:class 1b ribonucleoside-diphosphate reductase subunit alpha [Candidatus Mycoplasma mahonii]WKX02626.1 class 1b ribonucleoside-diphosphate reductase subunit alpha [Candidatus Mycoplasma mahonii]